MTLERWFRLSAYGTLALSCLALVFAEVPFLPSLQICLAPVLALLVLAWWVEGRWSLPGWGVNVLAALIAVGAASWVMTQLSDDDSWAAHVPVRLAMVPYMGPLVMAALLVKLFQARRPGDFWRVQGLGLTQVGLGCVLADGLGFGGVLAAYLAAALACLALHYRLSAAEPSAPKEASPSGRPPFIGWWLVRFTSRWALLVGALALLLFLLTPRRDDSVWEPLENFRAGSYPHSSPRVGAAAEINLNGVGTVALDDEPALLVAVADAAGRPRSDLPADQRWRGGALDWYKDGKWTTPQQVPVLPPRGRRQRRLPDLGRNQLFLTFTVQPRQAGGLVLAEPIRFGPPDAPLPALAAPGEGRFPLFLEWRGSIIPVYFTQRECRYRQVLPADGDLERTPARGLSAGRWPEYLTWQSVSGLHEWTVDLLRRLSVRPGYSLPNAVRADLAKPAPTLLVDPEHWEAVARVLTRYLSASGEFTYTLELTRQDRTLDPVMDFLLNLRQGHCERYASALALMLRALGIPSRVVKGYRGADGQGDGVYIVRHRHAHAWVEMLAPPRGLDGAPFDWLTLDPTPSESAPSASSSLLRYWLQESQRVALQMWQSLILDYNADEQAGLMASLKAGRWLALLRAVGSLILAALSAFVAVRLLRRWLRRRVAPVSPSLPGFYARLLTLLARYGAPRPRAGQTPREFGEIVRQFLRERPALAALADVPGRAVECLYRLRFGGRPLAEEEAQALDAELDHLAEALRQEPHA